MFINKTTIRITKIYVVATAKLLALFFNNLLFLYTPSIFLHGIYNRYATSIAIKNGFITFIKLLSHSPMPVKLSKTLYTITIATIRVNQ